MGRALRSNYRSRSVHSNVEVEETDISSAKSMEGARKSPRKRPRDTTSATESNEKRVTRSRTPRKAVIVDVIDIADSESEGATPRKKIKLTRKKSVQRTANTNTKKEAKSRLRTKNVKLATKEQDINSSKIKENKQETFKSEVRTTRNSVKKTTQKQGATKISSSTSYSADRIKNGSTVSDRPRSTRKSTRSATRTERSPNEVSHYPQAPKRRSTPLQPRKLSIGSKSNTKSASGVAVSSKRVTRSRIPIIPKKEPEKSFNKLKRVKKLKVSKGKVAVRKKNVSNSKSKAAKKPFKKKLAISKKGDNFECMEIDTSESSDNQETIERASKSEVIIKIEKLYRKEDEDSDSESSTVTLTETLGDNIKDEANDPIVKQDGLTDDALCETVEVHQENKIDEMLTSDSTNSKILVNEDTVVETSDKAITELQQELNSEIADNPNDLQDQNTTCETKNDVIDVQQQDVKMDTSDLKEQKVKDETDVQQQEVKKDTSDLKEQKVKDKPDVQQQEAKKDTSDSKEQKVKDKTGNISSLQQQEDIEETIEAIREAIEAGRIEVEGSKDSKFVATNEEKIEEDIKVNAEDVKEIDEDNEILGKQKETSNANEIKESAEKQHDDESVNGISRDSGKSDEIGDVFDNDLKMSCASINCSVLRRNVINPQISKLEDSIPSFSVVSYNISNLNLTKNLQILIDEIIFLKPSILCFQGIKVSDFANVLENALTGHGYKGFISTSKPGSLDLATFFLVASFELVQSKSYEVCQLLDEELQRLNLKENEKEELENFFQTNGQVLISTFKCNFNNYHLTVGSVNLPSRNELEVIIQASTVIGEILKMAKDNNYVVCGTFTLEQDSTMHNFLKDRNSLKMENLEDLKMTYASDCIKETNSLRIMMESLQRNSTGLKSSYSSILKRELAFPPKFVRDSIWFNSNELQTVSVLDLDDTSVLPFNSPDVHFSLKAELQFLN